MSPRTLFISRLLGLYLILASLSMVAHPQATISTVAALVHNPPVMLVVSILTLVAGLAIVLSHNVWSGGALPVVVTLSGWLMLLKGLIFLLLPPEAHAAIFVAVRYAELFYLYPSMAFLFGAYLTYGGFAKLPS